MTNDCKHENITLDDLGIARPGTCDSYLKADCPDCGKELLMFEIKKLGYKLVNVDSHETLSSNS